MSHRIFVAVPISPFLQDAALEWEKSFSDLPVRWLAGKNLHITLVPPWYEKDTDSAKDKLNKITAAGGFEIEFKKINFGPDPHRPRLIWAEGSAPKEIVALKDGACEIFNRPKESRPFLLHLTLARFRPETFSSFVVKKLDERVAWTDNVRSIVLMESHLSRRGADYEIIAESNL